jgi:phosphocarrier protein FPr
MVNLLLVSHSKNLAESAAHMALQMIASGNVKIAAAAGIGEGNQELGTNAMEISEKIQEIFTDEGVLVLMDLGSAVLSTQMALDLLPDEIRSKVVICPAPFVEGAVVAAAQASAGSSLEEVYREAVGSIRSKVDSLKEDEEVPSTAEDKKESQLGKEGQETSEVILTLTNEHGLHARPGVRFVQTASVFDADIQVTNLTTGKGPSSAKSLTAVTFLGALQGHQIKVTATGKQGQQALKALSDLIESNFKEEKAD